MPSVSHSSVFVLLAFLLLLAGCSPNSSAPAPRASASASNLKEGLSCEADDVPLNVVTLGWGFCHPKGWSIVQRSISTSAPRGVDTTLDVVASDGFFGFMIVGSYDRGGAADLKTWLAQNEPEDSAVQPITWGNAREAVQVTGQLKRYALTDNRVYALTEREGAGNLDVDAAMQPRLRSWDFVI